MAVVQRCADSSVSCCDVALQTCEGEGEKGAECGAAMSLLRQTCRRKRIKIYVSFHHTPHTTTPPCCLLVLSFQPIAKRGDFGLARHSRSIWQPRVSVRVWLGSVSSH
jgi:hypothetical protein